MLFQQVRNGEPGPQRGAVTVIECEKLLDRSVAQDMRHPPPEIIARPLRAKPLTLKREKCDFIERIIDTKARVKFETVNDPDPVIQPDMFRPEIAVTVHDPPVAQARRDLMAIQLQKTTLSLVYLVHEAARNPKPRLKQHALVIVEASCPIGQMDCRRQINRRCRTIKKSQGFDQAIELADGQGPALRECHRA